MKYVVEESLDNFEAWSGGKDTLDTLREKGDVDSVECLIDEYISASEDGWRCSDINDFLWFERDTIAQHLGYSDWDEYEYGKSEDSVEEEWEEKDSCWGYYGELDDEHIGYILDGAGFKREELEEVD